MTNPLSISGLEAEVVKLEQELRAIQARLRSYIYATPDTLVISDAKGIINIAKQLVEKLLGYCRGQFCLMGYARISVP